MTSMSVQGIPQVRGTRKRHKPPKADIALGPRRKRRRRPANADLLLREKETQWGR
jgi:hypothetical protein